jgi:hypothetical protein
LAWQAVVDTYKTDEALAEVVLQRLQDLGIAA